MKDLFQGILESSFKWLLGALVTVGTAYFSVEAWVNGKAEAVENRIMTIRQIDMKYLDQRLKSIDRKLDRLIERTK